jgi:cysteine desulfuration protein SufE
LAIFRLPGAHLGWFLPFPAKSRAPFLVPGAVADVAFPAYIALMDTLNATRTSFDDILTDFDLLSDWEDRYRYVIELGRGLEPLPESDRSPATKVQGCVSQVWLSTRIDRSAGTPRLTFVGDSDAHIVRGLIAILFALYSGRTPKEILSIDAGQKLGLLHLKEHLTPQRSNGLMAMVKRIRSDAEGALARS